MPPAVKESPTHEQLSSSGSPSVADTRHLKPVGKSCHVQQPSGVIAKPGPLGSNLYWQAIGHYISCTSQAIKKPLQAHVDAVGAIVFQTQFLGRAIRHPPSTMNFFHTIFRGAPSNPPEADQKQHLYTNI